MTAVLDLVTGQAPAVAALRAYLGEVARALGCGPEACTVDQDAPVSAYVALDARLPAYPDRDFALLWDEETGWAAAIETHSGEDLIVVDHLGGELLPSPERVARFVERVRSGVRVGAGGSRLRSAGDLDALAALLSAASSSSTALR